MVKGYRCRFCSRTYSTKHNLRLHMMARHPEEYIKPLLEKGILFEAEPALRCPICGKVYLTIQGYARHYVIGHRRGDGCHGP